MRKYFVPFLAAIFLPMAAFAQTGEAQDFAALDANSDHQISLDEAQADEKLAAEFSQVDADSDGNVSMEEFQIAMNAAATDTLGGQ
jgi:Ca2+-binding EF-hand superfamily protein